MPLDLKTTVFRDPLTGFSMTHTAVEQVYQKLKTLLLLSPNERMMHPKMGVGLKRFLFAGNVGGLGPDGTDLYGSITARVIDQVNTYMPYIEIEDIIYGEVDRVPNAITMRIVFRILGITRIHFNMLDIWAQEDGHIRTSIVPGPAAAPQATPSQSTANTALDDDLAGVNNRPIGLLG